MGIEGRGGGWNVPLSAEPEGAVVPALPEIELSAFDVPLRRSLPPVPMIVMAMPTIRLIDEGCVALLRCDEFETVE